MTRLEEPAKELRVTLARKLVRSDGHGEVRSFSSHIRSLRGVEPLPADLAKGVGSALGWGPAVIRTA